MQNVLLCSVVGLPELNRIAARNTAAMRASLESKADHAPSLRCAGSGDSVRLCAGQLKG
jgi:hypothetical protein